MALPEKRWIQRLDNFQKAFAILERIHDIQRERELTEAEKMGLIQAFEFSFELSWNLMKDFLTDKGITEIIGSKDAVRNAFKNGIIENGEVWMNMIDSRNETSHTYDENTALRVITSVSDLYIEEMKTFLNTMIKYKSENVSARFFTRKFNIILPKRSNR